MAWNGFKTTSATSPAKRPERRGNAPRTTPRYALAAGLIVVALGGVATWLIMGRSGERTIVEQDEKSATKRAIAEVKPNISTNRASVKPAEPKVKPVEKKRPPAPWRSSKMTDAEKAVAYEKALAERPLASTSSNRLYRSGIEQQIDWVFTTELGDMPPPLPHLPDHDLIHLQEILDLKNEVKKGDSEEVANAKQTVDAVKKELKEYVEKGGAPEEFLAYYHDKLQSAYMERRLATEQTLKILRDDPDLADDYVAKVNESLAKKGIKGIEISRRMRLRANVMVPKETIEQSGESR